MLSVIIPTLDAERGLVATLAALVPGAMEGLISEVVIADGNAREETAAIADVAGCNLSITQGPLGRRLTAAAAAARAPWLLFLQPGTILDASWSGAARRFLQQAAAHSPRAAAFRRGTPPRPALREAFALLAAALGATPAPRPEQGLLIAKPFYQQLGGHRERAADAEADLLRRIGRRRIVVLSAGAYRALDT